MTRSYESNGPDVKIRGSAQQIAEKYTALARDAQGAGDRVMAENYLQHAEHYNRIIAAAQAQLQIQTQRDYRDEYDDEDDVDLPPVQERRAPPANDGNGPQPVINGVPAEVALNEPVPVTAPSNGSAEPAGSESAEAQAEQPKPSRRVRRPRKSAKTAEAAEKSDSGDGEDKAEAATDSDSQLAAAGS